MVVKCTLLIFTSMTLLHKIYWLMRSRSHSSWILSVRRNKNAVYKNNSHYLSRSVRNFSQSEAVFANACLYARRSHLQHLLQLCSLWIMSHSTIGVQCLSSHPVHLTYQRLRNRATLEKLSGNVELSCWTTGLSPGSVSREIEFENVVSERSPKPNTVLKHSGYDMVELLAKTSL